MGILRLKKSDAHYRVLIKKGLLSKRCYPCKGVVKKKLRYWKIIENEYPWDRIAKVHDLIVPIRHTTEDKLTKAELKEFHKIKNNYIHGRYEIIVEATRKKRSIPDHFHLHLIVVKDFGGHST